MKNKAEVKKTRFSILNVIIIVLVLIIAGSVGYIAYRRSTVDKSMIGEKGDLLASNENINVMLTRPDNWRQIASKSLLYRAEFAQIDGSTATIPITAELARQFCAADDDIISAYVRHNTTHNAYVNLISGDTNTLYGKNGDMIEQKVHLIFATSPSDEELEMAEGYHVELEVEPVAMDGFVFITHKDNPVDSLTVQQVRDIYSGKITNWSEVGGKDEKIRAFQREKNSGSQTAMEELVMQGEPLTDCPKAYVPETMGALVERVAEYENEECALGYTYYYYINNLYKNQDIKVLKIDGISPDNENLLSGDYPFTASYYVVIRSDEPEDSDMRKLRDYMLSDEGQAIVELAGYCPAGGKNE
ncbi:MAG: PstS family phosphate ABC transporter substrate-binding protein [Ruminococcus sp.]|nr:PstS family phosphate ABC transporter substrate-binding protein [Ruminococcus sp.]